MRFLSRARALLLALSLLLTSAAPNAIAADNQTFFSTLSAGDLQALRESALMFRAFGQGPAIQLTLPISGRTAAVQIEPTDIRSPNYKSEFTSTDGLHADPTKVDLYKGTLDTKDPSDFIRLALISDVSGNEYLTGVLQADGTFYSLSSQKGAAAALTMKQLSTAELSDLLSHCGVQHLSAAGDVVQSDGFEHTSAYKQAEIATEADFEYFQAYGSNQGSANANILAIVNGVAGIYETQLNVTFSVVYQHAWTVAGDPYSGTDSSALLDQFVSYWSSNVRSTHPFDVAHLWTGRDLDSNVVGLAYVGVVCGSLAYGLSQNIGATSYDVPLAAHEIGHNFNADHDSCSGSDRFLMCPFLIQNANTFSPTSLSTISSFVNAVSCLATVNPGTPGGGAHAPVLSPVGAQSTTEYSTLSLTLSATDEDGGALTYSLSPAQNGMSLSGTSFSYTPSGSVVTNGAASATVNVTFTVTDSSGLSDSETVVITVASNNLSPTIASPGTKTASQGTTFTFQASGSDTDGDRIVYSAPSGLPPGALLNSASGVLTWRPAGNQSGSFAVPIRVTDTYGATGQATLTISVSTTPGVAPLPARHARPDFDGDGLADIAVYRPTTGQWFTQGMFTGSAVQTTQWGLSGDIPVPGDYNADRITDYAVYRPSNQSWYIWYSGTGDQFSGAFGLAGDIPAPGDYDGDGRWDIAVFRPSIGMLIYSRSSDSASVNVTNVGGVGDVPVPCDYDGDGKFDAAVYRPTTSQWLIQRSSGGSQSTAFGNRFDIPVPNDYDGSGDCELAVWRPVDGSWYVESSAGTQFGLGEDLPVAADYNGDGAADLEVFRPSIANWFFRASDGSASVRQLGLPTDLVPLSETYLYASRTTSTSTPAALGTENRSLALYERSAQALVSFTPTSRTVTSVPAGLGAYILSADYDGDGANDTAVFGGGLWVVYQTQAGVRAQFWGQAGDIPVTGDYDGDGRTDITVFRPNDSAGFSAWYAIRSSDGGASAYQWGLTGDEPVPADFNGDGITDPTVWRPSAGYWFVLNARSSQLMQAVQWGLAGDRPRVADFDGDGRADKVVWRPAQGNWFVLYSSGATATLTQWGRPGDVPMPGKYNSSTSADFAVYRPSAKAIYIRLSNGLGQTIATGLSTSAQAVAISPDEALR